QSVGNAKRMASEALSDIRRSVSALRESQDSFSLEQSLHELVDNMENSPFSIELEIEGEETGFSKQSLLTLYRAAQEGLTNVQKHAQAHHVTVRAELVGEEAKLHISDDGQGFDLAILQDLPPGQGRGYGLMGVQERLALIRGYFKLESQPNAGTNLFITVPKSPLALGDVG
ncbi:MAG: ATP-binding protein, partial [Chloroflexota bacterium]